MQRDLAFAPDSGGLVGRFAPAHYVFEATAPFFARRSASMPWTIETPYRIARWDGVRLAFTP